MRSFEITETKTFMTALLSGSTFDNFAVSEVKLLNGGCWEFDGHRNRDYYDTSELELLEEKEFFLWSEIKPQIFNLIRGNKLPLLLKITLRLNQVNMEKTIIGSRTSIPVEQVGGIFLNIQYDRENFQVITGTALKSFSMDRSLDNAWDEYAEKFLKKNELL